MKERLSNIVLEHNTFWGKVFDLSIQFLIFISLLSFSFETLPNYPPKFYSILNTIEVFTVILFTIEYFLRIWLEPNKLRFILSFYGLIDLLAILPFYISTGLDLRSIRALRLLRLFKFFRYSKTIQRMHIALKIAKQELTLFFTLTCILLYLAAVGIYYFENATQPLKFSSILDSLWWGVATLTTVGYGDAYPITAGGKIFTFFILMLGLGIVAIPAGIIASAVTKARELVKEEDSD
ncbi:ion transporter [Fulvivirga lutea]|uniref:Ion transporter n=1 Tax=Fulvivirga lutea TaxID=2810512 RepID=A0A974WE90_9BACT|nr:ion transporter [Fulvivirga lutea]QSE96421.1 ion transporter [Fulvivirga lutea]